ncbi:MAG: DNA methyltransferase, partial [Sulfuricella sp.]
MTDLFHNQPATTGPVECLGQTFPSEDARREHFLNLLREKLKYPEFRKIEGFPVGTDEDILALSDPPYYTACPNPFIADFIQHYGKPYDPNVPYSKEPFAADVSEGKNDPIYNAHSYHTKVPHKAIMRYILHYTQPGDVVFDGFCGTGMTGVAAQLCGDHSVIESMGYRVGPDGTILSQEQEDGRLLWKPFSKIGPRHAVLNDLSPAATYIASNYNNPLDPRIFEEESRRLLSEVNEEFGWMYQTLHSDGRTNGRINYVVWSDVFSCPECAGEVVFWDVAVDREVGKINDEFPCPYCSAVLTKRNMERYWLIGRDSVTGDTTKLAKQAPVWINYSIGSKRFEKRPDSLDFANFERIERETIPYWFPTENIRDGDKTGEPVRIGITRAHQFYSKSTLAWLAALRDKAERLDYRYLVTFSTINTLSKMYRYVVKKPDYKGQGGGILSGTLYIPSLNRGLSVISSYERGISRLSAIFDERRSRTTLVTTESADSLRANDNSI